MSLIWQPLSLVALALAVYIGLKFPDLDQRAGFLLHRSIITHGPWLSLLAFAFALGNNPVQRRLGAGICIGIAVHMAFDLFPRAWQGYALISLPVYGWTPSVFSWLWISATMLISFGLATKLCRNAMDLAILFLAVVGALLFVLPNEDALWRPMAVTAAGLLVCFWMVGPDKESDGRGRRTDFQ